MPGITGIIRKKRVGDESEKLESMLDCMLHERFYSSGRFVDDENGFYVAFVAIEGSFADCMPVFNGRRNIVLFLTGECYVDDGILSDLGKGDVPAHGENAEFLVSLYERNKEEFFKNLNGWYNGLILDLEEGKAVLFNDRYGMRRIYYHENEHGFFFSSEAKSLLKIFPALKELNPQSVGEFLVYDCVLDNKSYFRNISLLPSGSKWTMQGASIHKDKGVDVQKLENQEPLSEEEFTEEFVQVFPEILPRYFREDRIGMSLTGGLDTRLMMACLHPEPGRLPCYTFGGTYRDIFDVRLAPKVAKLCGQEHHVLSLNDEKYLKEYPFHLERSIYITDGVESVDKTDVIHFNKLAREIAPIRMSGKYGSQVLKNVFGFQERPPDVQLIHEDFRGQLDLARETSSAFNQLHPFSFMLYCEIPWWWNGFVASESSQVSIRSPYLDNDLIALLYRAPSHRMMDGVSLQLRAIQEMNPTLMVPPTTGSYGGGSWPVFSTLRKNVIKFLINLDKMHIRERLPYSLTHTVGKIDYWLHRMSLDRRIFGFTDFRRYRAWYRDQLSSFVVETLLSEKTYSRPYWNKEYLDRVVSDHMKGRGTYLREIRKVLQIEMIHRVLLEGKY